MSKLALAAIVSAAAGVTGGCSAPQDSGPTPPSADEQHAVADATAMIPPAERAAAPAIAPATGDTATPDPARKPKPTYRTVLPGQTPAR